MPGFYCPNNRPNKLVFSQAVDCQLKKMFWCHITFVSGWFVFSLLAKGDVSELSIEEESAGVENGKKRGSKRKGWDRNSRGKLFWLIGGPASLSLYIFLSCSICSLWRRERERLGYTDFSLVHIPQHTHSCLLSRWLRSHVELIVDDSFPATLPDRSPILISFVCSWFIPLLRSRHL